jgi:hypothetical protein
MTGVRLIILAVCNSSSLHSEARDIESLHPTRPRPMVDVESRDEERLLELEVLVIVIVLSIGSFG